MYTSFFIFLSPSELSHIVSVWSILFSFPFPPPPSLFSLLSLWIKSYSFFGHFYSLFFYPCPCHFSLCMGEGLFHQHRLHPVGYLYLVFLVFFCFGGFFCVFVFIFCLFSFPGLLQQTNQSPPGGGSKTSLQVGR